MKNQPSFEDYEEALPEHDGNPEFLCPHTGKICCKENESIWCERCFF